MTLHARSWSTGTWCARGAVGALPHSILYWSQPTCAPTALAMFRHYKSTFFLFSPQFSFHAGVRSVRVTVCECVLYIVE